MEALSADILAGEKIKDVLLNRSHQPQVGVYCGFGVNLAQPSRMFGPSNSDRVQESDSLALSDPDCSHPILLFFYPRDSALMHLDARALTAEDLLGQGEPPVTTDCHATRLPP